jgi:hypothetical protein
MLALLCGNKLDCEKAACMGNYCSVCVSTIVMCENKWDCGKAAWETSVYVSTAVWEQVGLWEGCVGTSGNVSITVWEQVGLWEGCLGD